MYECINRNVLVNFKHVSENIIYDKYNDEQNTISALKILEYVCGKNI